MNAVLLEHLKYPKTNEGWWLKNAFVEPGFTFYTLEQAVLPQIWSAMQVYSSDNVFFAYQHMLAIGVL